MVAKDYKIDRQEAHGMVVDFTTKDQACVARAGLLLQGFNALGDEKNDRRVFALKVTPEDFERRYQRSQAALPGFRAYAQTLQVPLGPVELRDSASKRKTVVGFAQGKQSPGLKLLKLQLREQGIKVSSKELRERSEDEAAGELQLRDATMQKRHGLNEAPAPGRVLLEIEPEQGKDVLELLENVLKTHAAALGKPKSR